MTTKLWSLKICAFHLQCHLMRGCLLQLRHFIVRHLMTDQEIVKAGSKMDSMNSSEPKCEHGEKRDKIRETEVRTQLHPER